MTTTTATKEVTYNIEIPVSTTYLVSVTREEGISKDELIESITREELSAGDMGDVWSDIKGAFRSGDDFFITDEDWEPLYQN